VNPYRAAREAAEIPSQNQAAPLIGIRQSLLSEYETGKKHPGSRTAIKMAKAYGLTVGQVLGLEPLSAPKSVLASDFATA
jgi:DNA-binding XRE family transcriptional regulator